MKQALTVFCLMILLTVPSACARPQGTTRADYGRITELRLKYKDAFVFKKKDSTLLVYQMTDGPVDDKQIEQMYREFFLDLKGRFRNNTAMKDLKLHDAQGKVLYGLRYVWWKGSIRKE